MNVLLLLVVAWVPAPLRAGLIVLVKRSRVQAFLIKVGEKLAQPFAMPATFRNGSKFRLSCTVGHTVLNFRTPATRATSEHVQITGSRTTGIETTTEIGIVPVSDAITEAANIATGHDRIREPNDEVVAAFFDTARCTYVEPGADASEASVGGASGMDAGAGSMGSCTDAEAPTGPESGAGRSSHGRIDTGH